LWRLELLLGIDLTVLSYINLQFPLNACSLHAVLAGKSTQPEKYRQQHRCYGACVMQMEVRR
jgi:hypothetical protein